MNFDLFVLWKTVPSYQKTLIRITN